MEWVLETLKGAKELAAFVKSNAGERIELRRRQELQEIVEALRLIYFSPRGVIKLLNDLAEGISPTEDQIAMILPEFNEYEFRVHRMLRRIAPEDGRVQGNLTLRAERILMEISYGKQGVRGKVKDLLNEALSLGKPVSKKNATALRDQILALNEAIEEAEEAIVQAIR